uniref:Biotin [acetyl-CoA-carboxylase] ligase n=1 Tax=Aquifex aeolicus TaxID=63363 RepID=UPI0001A5DE6A|nr:Chain A, Biotin [acetyl-CoA-carboxylase] ligase [Aquifex aeolicus]3EFS_B Chain B, Biotin [acetyl-CoA-carboxylase] ligase [Aquifex aeolicus]3FJP_A Chain A, Biotin [acetyl-CoA-carboxylase] ligase [Aquifex aeolicus]3FJP_B Chain B, Biotin [acetyl-CoA-carboxylase] ligase [Aquifex aeolicus]
MFKNLIWLKEVDSTQERLKEWNVSYGTALVADRQTKGRGRLGRKWLSQEGGLYFSFLLNPKEFENLLQLPLVLGLSVSEALEEITEIPFSLKWPNDVYFQEKKVSGVLRELSKDKLIVGIGINVNQREIPEEIKDRATTLYEITGKDWDRKEVLLKVLKRISENLKKFKEKSFKEFKGKIESKMLYLGEEVKLLGEGKITGKLVGLSEKGGALILTEEGIKEILSGEFSLRRS